VGAVRAYREGYEHPVREAYRSEGIREGHGDSDYFTLRAFVDAVARDVRPPIDEYDAATRMAIAPLSEQSIALGSTGRRPGLHRRRVDDR